MAGVLENKLVKGLGINAAEAKKLARKARKNLNTDVVYSKKLEMECHRLHQEMRRRPKEPSNILEYAAGRLEELLEGREIFTISTNTFDAESVTTEITADSSFDSSFNPVAGRKLITRAIERAESIVQEEFEPPRKQLQRKPCTHHRQSSLETMGTSSENATVDLQESVDQSLHVIQAHEHIRHYAHATVYGDGEGSETERESSEYDDALDRKMQTQIQQSQADAMNASSANFNVEVKPNNAPKMPRRQPSPNRAAMQGEPTTDCASIVSEANSIQSQSTSTSSIWNQDVQKRRAPGGFDPQYSPSASSRAATHKSQLDRNTWHSSNHQYRSRHQSQGHVPATQVSPPHHSSRRFSLQGVSSIIMNVDQRYASPAKRARPRSTLTTTSGAYFKPASSPVASPKRSLHSRHVAAANGGSSRHARHMRTVPFQM